MAYDDLRTFLRDLERQGALLRVDKPVDPILESTALCLRSLQENGPALLFEAPRGSDLPLLGNLFGSPARIQAALHHRAIRSFTELGELLASLQMPKLPRGLEGWLRAWPEYAQLANVRPEQAAHAPFEAQILEGAAVDLSLLPIQQCWPEDAGRLITFGLVVTRGLRQTRQNVAVYRQQLIGPNRVIMRWLPHRGGALDYADWLAAHPQEPFPVAVVIGADPCTQLAAVSPIPDTLSEYEFAGLLRGQPTLLRHSRHTGLDVPAGAEIVLEGHIHPGDRALEGPFGDHTGYYNSQAEFPVLTVERLCLRAGAIYQGSYMGRPPLDEPSVLARELNDLFVPLLRHTFPEILDFYLPPEACSYRIAVVSLRKQYPGHARRIMMGIWSWLRQFTYTKFVIVVDGDIDIRNWSEVIWAISTRMDPVRDCLLIENTPIDYLDFASPEAGLGGKMGLDATNKWPGETHRSWGRPIQHDPDFARRMDALWQSLSSEHAA